MGDIIVVAIIIVCIMYINITDKKQKIRELEEKIVKLSDRIHELEKNNNAIESKNEKANSEIPIIENISQQEYLKELSQQENSNIYAGSNTVKNDIEFTEKTYQEELSQQKNSNIYAATNPVNDEKDIEFREEKVKKNRKNNIIFTIGATFVIVAAVSFLYSTWHVVPDIVKTSIILVFAFLFLGLAKVAEDVFKLSKTAKVFFYMAMVYIPIGLFSISAFGLIGNYLSMSGEGKYVYLSLASFAIMAIYLFYAYKNKDKKLYFSGRVMQLLMIIFFTLIMTEDILNIILVIIIYSVILNIMNCKFESVFKKESELIKDILLYAMTGATLMLTFYWHDEKEWIYKTTYLFLTTFNFVLSYLKNKKEYLYIISYVLTYVFLYSLMQLIGFGALVQQIIVIMYLCATAYYHNFVNKNDIIKNVTNYIDAFLCIILCFISYCIDVRTICIKAYVMCMITNIIMYIEYLKNSKKNLGLFALTLIINFILMLFVQGSIVEKSLCQYISTGIFSLIFIMFLHNEKNTYIKIIPILYFIANLYTRELIVLKSFNITYLTAVLSMLAFGYLAIKDKKDYVYRGSSFVLLLSISQYINTDIAIYVESILITIWAVVQMLFAKKEIKTIMKWLIVLSLLYMYSLMFINATDNEITPAKYTLGIIHSLMCMFIFSRSKNLKFLPLIGLAIPLYSYDIILLGKYDITLIINLAMIVIFAYLSLTGKKDYKYQIVSLVYLLGFICKYSDINEYVRYAMVFIWSGIQCFYTKGARKDANLALTGLAGLFIYMNMIYDLKIDEITLIRTLGFIIYAYIVLHKIIEKYSKETCRMLESFFFIIVYLISFFMYKDAIDLAIFMFMQACIIVLTYIKRYGPAFIITSCGIIINLIYLTREFWLSIPWWAYLVVVGGILLFFAARNELLENKNKKLVKENLEKIKKYFDI